MKKLIAVTLLTCISACGQTTTKHKAAVAVTAPAVSDAFAKSALHVLMAMRDAKLLSGESEHIATLFENMEVEASTPVEKQLTAYLSTRNTLHNLTLQELNSDLAMQPMDLSKEDATEYAVHTTGASGDWACFNAYIALLKVNDSKTDLSSVPVACSLENPAKDSYDQLTVCCHAGLKAGEVGVPTQATVDKCRGEYLTRNKALKENGWVKVTPSQVAPKP